MLKPAHFLTPLHQGFSFKSRIARGDAAALKRYLLYSAKNVPQFTLPERLLPIGTYGVGTIVSVRRAN
jgi:hypothetical protein